MCVSLERMRVEYLRQAVSEAGTQPTPRLLFRRVYSPRYSRNWIWDVSLSSNVIILRGKAGSTGVGRYSLENRKRGRERTGREVAGRRTGTND